MFPHERAKVADRDRCQDSPKIARREYRIWGVLKPDSFTDFVQIADALEEIPWAVLDACRRLIKSKRAVAGTGPMKHSFKKVTQVRREIQTSSLRRSL
jgi:hypothetical protein